MRLIFICLLLLNIGFYVWQTHLASPLDAVQPVVEPPAREIELL
jgi:hypothetical protein